MAADVVYVPDPVVFNYEFKSRAGMMGRDLTKRGIQLQRLAQRQVGKKTGFLRISIGYDVNPSMSGLVLTVGSSARIAYIHHEGTRPHYIRPKQRSGALRFNQGGRIVYARRVLHPGTRPNRYLTDNLYRVVLT